MEIVLPEAVLIERWSPLGDTNFLKLNLVGESVSLKMSLVGDTDFMKLNLVGESVSLKMSLEGDKDFL